MPGFRPISACYTPLVTARLRRPSGLALLALVMLVLLPVLAGLQYRWVGQLSDGDRHRLQRGLRAMTKELTQAVDLELARVIVALQLESSIVLDEDWERFADKYQAWRASARHTQLVEDVLLVDAPASRGGGRDPLRLRRWNAHGRTFEEMAWPADLDPLRVTFSRELAGYLERPEPLYVTPADLLAADGSALVMPVMTFAPPPPEGGPPRILPVFAFTIVRFDTSLLEGRFLPQLVARHFGQAPHDYLVAVVTRGASGRVVYETEPGDAESLEGRADVREPFFGIGHEQFPLLRQAAASLRTAAEPLGADRPEPRRNFVVGLFGRRSPDTAAADADDGSRWMLLVRHRAGSVESAVAQARQRNLALSFGILLLMAGSVALIVVAARRAQRLARQQIEFVAAVSHELRTPVSVIGAAADNLAHGVVRDPARVKQYGGTIQTEVRRLAETVERVLQFAGIQSGRVVDHRSPVHPAAIVQDALAASRQLIEETGTQVETRIGDALPTMIADATALRSAVQNLIVNAIKYGGQSPWMRVSVVACAARRGREVRISVEDRGAGIAPTDLPHVHEPFYRGADAVARQIKGNGLGLAIVKHVVEAHGGRLALSSTPGRGSTFTLHLPVSETATAASPNAVEHEAHA